MTRSQLMVLLAKRFPKVDNIVVEKVVKLILQAITNHLGQGNPVEIHNFGRFYVETLTATEIRNPKTRALYKIPERHTPKFQAASQLRQSVNHEVTADLSPFPESSTNRGGRPTTNGVSSMEHFVKANIACEAFYRLRQAGEKYETALQKAVDAVQAFDPRMKASTSFVKRILKEWMPEKGEEIIRITKMVDPHLPPDTNPPHKISYAIGFAPKPKFAHPSKRKK